MTVAGRTFDMEIAVGDAVSAAVLTPAMNSFSVRGLLEGVRAPVMGTRETEYVPLGAGMNMSILSAYVGAQTDAIRRYLGRDDAWCCAVDRLGTFFYLQSIFVPGVPESESSRTPITTSIDMEGTLAGIAGEGSVSVTPFTFRAGNVAADIGDVPAGAQVGLYIAEYPDGVAGANITVAGLQFAVSSVSVHAPRGVAAARNAATVNSAHALAGDRQIRGFALVGETLALEA
ncbi:MAG: hypothetical protein OXE50_02195 [Chloroflexi bacterium]|nr:hypothetical protein [Chloroflexota bacterium]